MTHGEYLAAFKQLTVSSLPSASDVVLSGFFSDQPIAMAYDTPQIQRMSIQVQGGAAGIGSGIGDFGDSNSGDVSPIETVRNFFPETWIWDLVEVG